MKKTSIFFGLMAMGVFATAQTRMSLYEEFTGENCPPCASTNPGLNTLLAANASKVIPIKWQVPIPSAPSNTWSLYQTDKAEIDWRWKPASTPGYGYLCATCSPTANYINFAPQGRMDGQELDVFGISQGGSTNHPGYLTAAAISSAQVQSTPFTITVTPTYDATFSNATVVVVVTSSGPFTAVGALKLRTVLVERAINFATAPGTNGEKDFYDAVRKVINPVAAPPTISDFGDALSSSWVAAQTQTITATIAIPSYIIDKSQMAFVSFIQDDGNRKVWQAARSAQASIPNDAKLVSHTLPSYTCATNINPSVNVLNQGPNAITAMTITPVIDGVNQTAYQWSGSLASMASTNIALGTFAASAGNHTVSFNISNVSGGDVNTANNTGSGKCALIQTYSTGLVVEPFTTTTFPPANWFVINTDGGATWSRNSSAGFNGAGAAKYDFFTNSNVGDADDMFITPEDLTAVANASVTFDVAYAQYASENDKLEVKVSTNCGQTWTTIFTKSGSVLSTSAAQTSAFTPGSNAQWRNEVVALPVSANNNPNVLVKFVATSAYGNNMYVDNVNISNVGSVGITTHNASNFNVVLYPNPSTDMTNLDVTSKSATKGMITVYNAIGQLVFEKEVQLETGYNNVKIDTKSLPTGIYNVNLTTGLGNYTNKLTVTK
jgi:hypothetical protein